jgi:death-on-curing protein
VGPNLLADFGLLESAVLRPQQTLFGDAAYTDVHSKAAALLHSLVNNHPFIDGNKRRGVLAMIVFYGLNGWELETDQESLVNLALDAATGRSDVEAIAAMIKGWARPANHDSASPP